MASDITVTSHTVTRTSCGVISHVSPRGAISPLYTVRTWGVPVRVLVGGWLLVCLFLLWRVLVLVVMLLLLLLMLPLLVPLPLLTWAFSSWCLCDY